MGCKFVLTCGAYWVFWSGIRDWDEIPVEILGEWFQVVNVEL